MPLDRGAKKVFIAPHLRVVQKIYPKKLESKKQQKSGNECHKKGETNKLIYGLHQKTVVDVSTRHTFHP